MPCRTVLNTAASPDLLMLTSSDAGAVPFAVLECKSPSHFGQFQQRCGRMPLSTLSWV
jgi:hypothetical protein